MIGEALWGTPWLLRGGQRGRVRAVGRPAGQPVNFSHLLSFVPFFSIPGVPGCRGSGAEGRFFWGEGK